MPKRSRLDATVKELEKVRRLVNRRRLQGRADIGVRIGKVINKYKVAKHIQLEIHDDRLAFSLKEAQIAAEAALDGLYVIRTSVPPARLDAADTVRSYKQLSGVERAFRSLKTLDLKVRPIYHRLEERVRAHIFLCLLAYYVEWHMREAWRPLLFADEDQAAKRTRDPVAPAQRSAGALRKVHAKVLDDGTPVHSFQTLLKRLSGIVRNVCRRRGAGGPAEATVEIVTTPSPEQQRAYDLLNTITV
jgi:transposase